MYRRRVGRARCGEGSAGWTAAETKGERVCAWLKGVKMVVKRVLGVAKKFPHRDSNPGRVGESHVS